MDGGVWRFKEQVHRAQLGGREQAPGEDWNCKTRRYREVGPAWGGKLPPSLLAIRKTASPSSSQGRDAEFLSLGPRQPSVRLAKRAAVVLKEVAKRASGTRYPLLFRHPASNTGRVKVLHWIWSKNSASLFGWPRHHVQKVSSRCLRSQPGLFLWSTLNFKRLRDEGPSWISQRERVEKQGGPVILRPQDTASKLKRDALGLPEGGLMRRTIRGGL
ncbi:hypothetical protein GWK47_037523 [Chionoecetes opilio]|uniref:Uncharacterized protein n=1 Tax=Chionoecetes opilio TaxID=41210 RepID=A0A8J4YDD6_CHIOP|nr:hypothetical protein GWK47_037523 [Chionoecetes opilio]